LIAVYTRLNRYFPQRFYPGLEEADHKNLPPILDITNLQQGESLGRPFRKNPHFCHAITITGGEMLMGTMDKRTERSYNSYRLGMSISILGLTQSNVIATENCISRPHQRLA
jgi:hypothetical protein